MHSFTYVSIRMRSDLCFFLMPFLHHGSTTEFYLGRGSFFSHPDLDGCGLVDANNSAPSQWLVADGDSLVASGDAAFADANSRTLSIPVANRTIHRGMFIRPGMAQPLHTVFSLPCATTTGIHLRLVSAQGRWAGRHKPSKGTAVVPVDCGSPG